MDPHADRPGHLRQRVRDLQSGKIVALKRVSFVNTFWSASSPPASPIAYLAGLAALSGQRFRRVGQRILWILAWQRHIYPNWDRIWPSERWRRQDARCSDVVPAAGVHAREPAARAPRSGLTDRSTRPVHLLGRRPDPLHLSGLWVRPDSTAKIVCCVDPTVNGLKGDVDWVPARGIAQLS